MTFKVYLGTPVAGGVVAHDYMHSVIAIQNHFATLGWQMQLVTQPDGLVTRPRNAFASVVVRDDSFTHLLMLDADVVIKPEAIERMVRSGHDVVGAGVPLRQVEWENVRAHLDLVPAATAAELRSISHRFAAWFEPPGGARVPTDGFLPAQVIGSAALLITRDALVRLVNEDAVAAFEFGGKGSDGEGSGWSFFDPYVNSEGVYLSEDYAFCDRWRNIGGQVWVDLESRTTHVGPVAVEGAIATTLKAATDAADARRARDQS
ncbi:MAG: hypothetical protein WA988_16890 [Candidatus Nanopelagicales bacterium]